MAAIARSAGPADRYVSRLRCALLAPDIVAALLAGAAPHDLTLVQSAKEPTAVLGQTAGDIWLPTTECRQVFVNISTARSWAGIDSATAGPAQTLWLAKNTNRTMIHRVREIPSNWARDSANQASLLRLRDTKTAENRRVSVISRGANADSRQALDWVAGGAGFKLKCSNAETYNPIQQSAPQRSQQRTSAENRNFSISRDDLCVSGYRDYR